MTNENKLQKENVLTSFHKMYSKKIKENYFDPTHRLARKLYESLKLKSN